MNKIADLMRDIVSPEKVRENCDMSREVTFRAGGKADIIVEPENTGQLREVLELVNREKVNFIVMGNGSNLLIRDGGFKGVVIKISGKAFKNIEIEEDGVTVKAGSGVVMGVLANFLAKNNLTGFEFASGIPGTVGGAVFMNAGAYGGEIKDVIVSADLVSKDGKREFKLKGEELDLTYRHSLLHNTEDIVTEVTFRFEKGNRPEIEDKMKELNRQRREKQPLNYPNAGSTFKRPDGYIAAKLIQDAGLKGYSVGNAQVSELHSGFVINKGGATASDILAVMKHCREVVQSRYGVLLEPEVRILGQDPEDI